MGGVVPHHEVATKMVDNFFALAQRIKPKRIIVLAPNHFKMDAPHIISSRRDWKSKETIIKAESSLVQKWRDEKLVVEDDEVAEREHAVGNMVPYIAKHFAKSKLIPLIIHPQAGREELDRLAEAVYKDLDESTLIVASVDFSHYLTSEEADRKDEKTLSAIRNRDWNVLLEMGSDNLDCSACIYVIDKIMRDNGKNEFRIMEHTNSEKILGWKSPQGVTSYFLFVYDEE